MERSAAISPATASTPPAEAFPLFLEVRTLWKRAERLEEVESDSTLFIRNKDGLLDHYDSDALPTERLEAGINAGHVYVFWGQQIHCGDAADELVPGTTKRQAEQPADEATT